jgi:hypothetical protein
MALRTARPEGRVLSFFVFNYNYNCGAIAM